MAAYYTTFCTAGFHSSLSYSSCEWCTAIILKFAHLFGGGGNIFLGDMVGVMFTILVEFCVLVDASTSGFLSCCSARCRGTCLYTILVGENSSLFCVMVISSAQHNSCCGVYL